jgi:cytoskeletal protein CcmA (bactofilin family)
MFELGKKDGGAAQPSSSSSDSVSARPSQPDSSTSRRSGTGQFAVIGRSIQINGDVKGDEDLLIEGDVSGTVELKNNSLTVGKEGKVKADIYARAVTVEGTTDGDLFASERIAIRASAEVKGNLVAPRISIEDGARFKGSVEMDQQAIEKALGSSSSHASRPASRAEPISAKANGDTKLAAGSAGAASAAS